MRIVEAKFYKGSSSIHRLNCMCAVMRGYNRYLIEMGQVEKCKLGAGRVDEMDWYSVLRYEVW